MRFWQKPIHLPVHGVNRRSTGRMLTDDGACEFGQLVDLSCSGLRLSGRGKCQVSVGDTFPITIACDDITVTVTVQVVWIERDRFRHFNIGARFCDLDNATRKQITQLSRVASSRLALV